MSEWWTYSLRDLLLFSPHTYYHLFELYNQQLFPVHFLVLGFVEAILLLIWQRGAKAGRMIAAILALGWLWVAWAYHYQRYASINWAANYYAVAFVLQALLLLWVGVIRDGLNISKLSINQQRALLAVLLLVTAGYLMLAVLFGRGWATAELVGMAPDPTALFTLCILSFISTRKNWVLYVIPVVWCLISSATLWAMNSPEYLVVLSVIFLLLIESTRKWVANRLN